MEGLSSLGMGLFTRMVDSWKKEQFCDITIKCSNLRKIKAPSILLGTISGKLSDVIGQCCDNTLMTSDVSIHLWKALLTIIYENNLDYLHDGSDTIPTVRDIRQFADCLEVQSVVDMCEKEMRKDSSGASQNKRYNYVKTNPLEFNLVFFVATDEGKERVTSLCQSKYNDPAFNQAASAKTVSQRIEREDTGEEVIEVAITGTKKKTAIVVIKKEMKDDCLSSLVAASEPVAESSARKSVRTRGKRKVYTPYGIKQENEEEADTVKTEEDGDVVDIPDDGSDDFVPEELDDEELDEDYTISEDEKGTKPSKGFPLRVKLASPAKKKTPDKNIGKKKKTTKEEKETETSDALLSKKVKICFHCHSKCKADFVQCRLCFQVVDGCSLKHVEDEHPLLDNVIWPVNCDIESLQADEETMMIGRSTVGYVDGESELGTVFQCMECIQMFVSQEEFDQHLRDHTSAVFSCRKEGCHFAFKTEAYRTEHQHFCMGGSILKCYSCQRLLGGMLGYNKHKCTKKTQNKTKTAPKTPAKKAKAATEKKVKADSSEKRHKAVPKTKYIPSPKKPAKPANKRSKQVSEEKTKSYHNEKAARKAAQFDIKDRIGTDLLPLDAGEDVHMRGHLIKCCKSCGFNCRAEVVQCLYCGLLVNQWEDEVHVLSEHSGTPKGHLWPVECSVLPDDPVSYVVCKYQASTVSLLSGLSIDTQELQSLQAPNTTKMPGSPTGATSDADVKHESPMEEDRSESTIVVLGTGESESGKTLGQAVCCLCDYSCQGKVDLKNHMTVAHQKTALFCPICEHGFDSMKAHENHTYYCEGNKMLTCIRCDLLLIGSLEDARQHEDVKHLPIYAFKHYRELKREPDTDGIGRVQRCFQCGENGCKAANVKCIYCNVVVPNDMAHMDTHPFVPEGSVWPVACRYNTHATPVSCEMGKKVLAQNEDGAEEGKSIMTCNVCDFTTDFTQTLVDHVKAKHHSKFVRACDYCESIFKKYEAWRDHDHFCGGGDLLTCALCATLCGGLKAMNDHLCRNHPEEKGLPSLAEKAARRYVYRPLRLAEEEASLTLTEHTQLCYVCGEGGCQKEKVVCIYCQEVVTNTPTHTMQHPFIPAGSSWPVTCDLSQAPQSRFVLAEKIYAGKRMNRVLHCNVCGKFTSKGYQEMMSHLGKAHQLGESVYKCKYCSTIMSIYHHAKDHEHFCGGGKLFKCEACDLLCGGFKYLMDHVTQEHLGSESQLTAESVQQIKTEDGKPVLADIDSNAALNDYFLEKMGDHTVETEDNYVGTRKQDCFVCEGKCRVALGRHLIKCMLCNDLVQNSPEHMLEKHVYTPPESSWPVTCSAYKKAFDTVVAEKSTTVHPADGLHRLECKLCSYQNMVGSYVEFIAHFKGIHKSTIYFCEHCDQGFKRCQMKKDHERLCGGLSFPSCSFCGRRCACYDALQEHIKHVHMKMRQKKRRHQAIDEEEDEEEPKGPKEIVKQLKVANFDVSKEEPDENGIVKLCVFCGTSCVSHDVRCMLCFRIVHAKSEHMLTDHPFTPSKSWVVNCKNTKPFRGGVRTKRGKLISLDSENFIVAKASSVAVVMNEAIEGDVAIDGQSGERVALDIECCLPHSASVAVLPNMEAFSEHIKEHHLNLGLRVLQLCRHCNLICSLRDYVTKSNFADHEHFCAGNGLYQCELCEGSFGSLRRLNEHMSAKHSYVMPPKQKTASPPIVVPEGRYIQCNECEYRAPSFNDYSYHVRMIHQYKKTQVQVCSYCFKAFRVCSKRELHEQVEHKGGGRFGCDICGREFLTPTSLKTHIKYYHEGGRIKQKIYRDNKTKIPCSFCGRLFVLGIHVRQHERTAHLNQKPYQCRVCGARFTNHSACKTHEDRHTGRKRYKCPHCDYRAYKGSRVNEHIKTKHPGRKRAFGWDVVDYANEVVDKGDEFVVEGNFSYKPRLKREEFDFGDYEDSFEPGMVMERPYRGPKSGRDFYVTSVDNSNHTMNLKMVPKSGEEVPMYYIKGAEGGDSEVPVYMSEEELQVLLNENKQKVEYVVGDSTVASSSGQQVQYVLSSAPSEASVKQEVQYVVDTSATPGVVGQDVQYVLGTDDDSRDVQYVIDSENVNDEAKQEVELIINSAVAEGSATSSRNRSLLKSFLRSSQGESDISHYTEAASDANNQVYYIVNK